MIEVFDDFITEANANALEKIVLDANFPWYANTTLSGNGKMLLPIYAKHSNPVQFTHMLYDGKDITSPLFGDVMSFFKELPECRTSRLIRAKFNTNLPYKQKEIHAPHLDNPGNNFISYLYYVNDSDGPTRMYLDWWKTKKIHPKKGRLVRFPSNTIHSGNVPHKYQRRVVLNLMFAV